VALAINTVYKPMIVYYCSPQAGSTLRHQIINQSWGSEFGREKMNHLNFRNLGFEKNKLFGGLKIDDHQ
jgi:hypothetical protein